MKNVVLVVCALLLISIPALSQISVGTGITGGLNFATIGGSDASGSKSTTQFSAGAFLDIKFPLGLSIQPEVLYSVKGYSFSGTASNNAALYSYDQTTKLTYLDVPVLVKFTLPLMVPKIGIFAGPSVGFLLTAKEKVDVKNYGSTDVDVKDEYAKTDFGIVVGAGVTIPLVIVDVSLDARYNFGLSTLDKDGNLKAYNRVFSVNAGIEF